MAFTVTYTATLSGVILNWAGATASGTNQYTNVRIYRGPGFSPSAALADTGESDEEGRQIAKTAVSPNFAPLDGLDTAATNDDGVLTSVLKRNDSGFTLRATVKCSTKEGDTYTGTYTDSFDSIPVGGYVYVLVDDDGYAVIAEAVDSTETDIKGITPVAETLAISTNDVADAAKNQQVVLQNKKTATKFNIDVLGVGTSSKRICLVAVALDGTADYTNKLVAAIKGVQNDSEEDVCDGMVLLANDLVSKITLSTNQTYKPILSGSVQLLYK